MEFRNNQSVYGQIVDVIFERILQGKWSPGEKLISIRELASELQVTPNTIQRAYDRLQELSVISPQRGIGLFVEPDAISKIVAYKKEQFINNELPFLFKTIDMLGMDFSELHAIYQKQKKSKGK